MVHTIARVLLSFLTLVLSTHAFYFPELTPTNFCRQQVLDADKNSGCIVRQISILLVCKMFDKGSLCRLSTLLYTEKTAPFLCHILYLDLFLFPSLLQVDVFVHVNKLDSIRTIIPYEYSRYNLL